MHQITIDNDIHNDLEKASAFTGLDERELAARAILFYLNTIRDDINLAKEFDAWDAASDEALINMERELAHGA